ncbi:site-specific integrase [Maribacter sp. MAR_2009_72]|uniref:site-specific integrase n=1 Tax=Maribacter sp. MAR_2009_72 TaxID=1250050 RepID=UPI001199F362|nr:site-specific integrase [Maribacter sp. MAR_2009_72]TVZ16409.1 site-specific recombinase XerD [Maribacter sp. MAR_2009_72]
MKQAEANIYLDQLRPRKNGDCSIKIKVTFNRKRKYYPTGIHLTPEEFFKLMNAERRTKDQKKLLIRLNHLLTKAQNVISGLTVFTFTRFEEKYFELRNTENSVSFAFENYIKELKSENRIGTAVSYKTAINSIEDFKKGLTFADITPTLLKQYESWMVKNNKSRTTVGIYLRSLRTIYNLQNIDKSLYPFGGKQGKYSIPTGQNVKKALTVEEIASIYNYRTTPNTTKDMAKDYWLFLYLSNGMNVKDFCLLKWKNIDGEMLTYRREKTIRNKKENKVISVALKPETWIIIKKWGVPSVTKESYIFPHIKNGMTIEKQRATYQQLTKIINKYMKLISADLGINKNVTTYFARHSFATVLKRSGANISMISDLLGHSSVGVTESYLDSFENDQIQKQTDVLTDGFKKAK